MKIKEINVEIKLSKNYNTYSCGETIIIEEGDNVLEQRKMAITRCRRTVMEQIEIDEAKR